MDITVYYAVKSIYIADLTHMTEFGRPVTFDNYVAMEFGPVPSRAYAMLKVSSNHWSRNGDKLFNARYADLADELSISDERALSDAWGYIKNLTFSDIAEATHSHKAWSVARENNPSLSAPQMNIFDMYDVDNETIENAVSASYCV